MTFRFTPCGCAAPEYVRERRSTWMRWFVPQARHWSCTRCGVRFLASKAEVSGMVAAPVPATAGP